MLSVTTVDYLRTLHFDPSSERLSFFLPLSVIYWSDEIPDASTLKRPQDGTYDQIMLLLRIRLQLWFGETVSVDDQAFWNAAVQCSPDCPIFQRLSLTEEDFEAQYDAEQLASEFLDGFAEAADVFEIDDQGNWSATFKANQTVRRSVWRRFVTWFRREMC